MAGKTCWGIDIGKYALKAVQMSLSHGEVEILDIVHIPYELTTGKEDEVQNAISEALAYFTEELNLRQDSVAVGLPGRVAFSRFINLPPVDPKKMNDFVSYEAQQQIPFPIDEVVWSFHCLEKDYEPGEEMEVCIFAIKKEIVEPFLNELSLYGIDPDTLTIGPLALLNFLKYDMDLPEEEAVLVVDIGADHTDLLVVQGEKFWIRNLPFAAKNFNTRIAKKLKVSYADAERLKCNIAKSKQGQKILKVVQPLYKDLCDEINRSMGFYKSQAGEVKFKKIILSGSGSKIYGLKKFLQKELRLEVQKINRLNRVKIDLKLETDTLRENIEAFGVPIGLALQGLKQGATKVNLLPQEKLHAKEEVKKRPFLIGSCVVLFLMIAAMYTMKSAELAKIKGIAEKLKDPRIDNMTPRAFVSKMNKLVAAEQNVYPIQVALNGMLEIGRHRDFALKVIKSLEPATKDNDKLKVTVPKQAAPKRPKDRPVLRQIENFYRGKLWILNLEFEDRYSYDTQRGKFKVALTTAAYLQGEMEEVVMNVISPKLTTPLKQYFKDYLPDPKAEKDKFQEAFQTNIPANPKRFALFDSEETKNEIDIFHPIPVFLYKLELNLDRGGPVVEAEKPAPPKRRKRRRRGRR
ncbi:MAG: type IV pilus assembly protein PilM [Planctomycetota bacterium]|nr:MAG: type IV pilus assembly protein PilM [Planctomycetota bacterium]